MSIKCVWWKSINTNSIRLSKWWVHEPRRPVKGAELRSSAARVKGDITQSKRLLHCAHFILWRRDGKRSTKYALHTGEYKTGKLSEQCICTLDWVFSKLVFPEKFCKRDMFEICREISQRQKMMNYGERELWWIISSESTQLIASKEQKHTRHENTHWFWPQELWEEHVYCTLCTAYCILTQHVKQ